MTDKEYCTRKTSNQLSKKKCSDIRNKYVMKEAFWSFMTQRSDVYNNMGDARKTKNKQDGSQAKYVRKLIPTSLSGIFYPEFRCYQGKEVIALARVRSYFGVTPSWEIQQCDGTRYKMKKFNQEWGSRTSAFLFDSDVYNSLYKLSKCNKDGLEVIYYLRWTRSVGLSAAVKIDIMKQKVEKSTTEGKSTTGGKPSKIQFTVLESMTINRDPNREGGASLVDIWEIDIDREGRPKHIPNSVFGFVPFLLNELEEKKMAARRRSRNTASYTLGGAFSLIFNALNN